MCLLRLDLVPSGDGVGACQEWSATRDIDIYRLESRRSSNTGVGKALLLHVFRTINISKINNNRAGHEVSQFLQLEGAELFPLGDDYRGISSFDAIVWVPGNSVTSASTCLACSIPTGS